MAIHVITMVPAVASVDPLRPVPSEQIQMLRDALMISGGKADVPMLVGDATVFTSQSIKASSGPAPRPFDIVVTRFESVQEYKEATQSDGYQKALKMGNNDKKIQVYGFENDSIYLDWVYPAIKSLYWILNWRVDCDTPVAPEISNTNEIYDLKQTNGDSGMENYKAKCKRSPDEKVYVIELMTRNDSSGVHEAEKDYNKAWLQAAFSYDVRRPLGGTMISLDDGPKTFTEVSIMEFPKREIYIKWLESDYFQKLQGTRQAFTLDSHVQVNLPLY